MIELLIIGVLVVAVVVWLIRRKHEAAGKRCWNCGHDLSDYDGYSCPNCYETIEQGDEPDDDIDPDEHPNRDDGMYDDDDDDDGDRAVVRR